MVARYFPSKDLLCILDGPYAVHKHGLPDGPVVLVELDDLRYNAEYRLRNLFSLAGIWLEVHHREGTLQDLVFVPVGVDLSDHLHGAFEQGYAVYSGWHLDGKVP